MKKFQCLCICSLLLLQFLKSQGISPFIISSAGGFYKPNDISISFTIGELVIETIGTTDHTLTQGFQQGSWTISSIATNPLPVIEIKVYPNPANDFIIIEWMDEQNAEFNIELYDLLGRKVIHKISSPFQTQLELRLDNLTQSVYILRIRDADNKVMKTFRIIKSQLHKY
jgi:hypothetical protein